MKILLLGAGKMGTFFTDVFCMQHEVALFDTDPNKFRFVFNTIRMTEPKEIEDFNPELVINAATINYTIDRKSTRPNSSHIQKPPMPSSA